MFYYHDEKDMLRAQKTLIELAFHCLMFVESARYDLKCFYYDIISLSIDRDELRLANVAISDKLVEANAQKEKVLSSSSEHTDPA